MEILIKAMKDIEAGFKCLDGCAELISNKKTKRKFSIIIIKKLWQRMKG